MDTQMQCQILLQKGYTLENQYGTKVHLEGDKQVCSKRNKNRRGKPYSFNNPQYWHVSDTSNISVLLRAVKWLKSLHVL